MKSATRPHLQAVRMLTTILACATLVLARPGTGYVQPVTASAAVPLAPPASGKETLLELEQRHPDDPAIQEVKRRMAAITEIADQVIAQFQAAESQNMDAVLSQVLGNKVAPHTLSIVGEPLTAAGLLRSHSSRLCLPIPESPLDEGERQLLLSYLESQWQSDSARVFDYPIIATHLEEEPSRQTLELMAVLPFLQVRDEAWTKTDVARLPARLRSASSLRILSELAACTSRPATALCMAQYSKGDAWDPPQACNYLLDKAASLTHRGLHPAATRCYEYAIRLAGEVDLQRTEMTARLAFAKLLGDRMEQHKLAAEHLRLALVGCPDDDRWADAAVERMRRLYLSEDFDTIMEESSAILQDTRCRRLRPQVMYISWVAHRRRNKLDQAVAIQEEFLKDYPDNLLCADMHFASAMTALASGDYEEASRRLEIIEYQYPQSSVAAKAKDIQKRLANSSLRGQRVPEGR